MLLQAAGVMVTLAAVTAPTAPLASPAPDADGLTSYAEDPAAATALPYGGTPLDGGGAKELAQPPVTAVSTPGPGAESSVLQATGGARLPSTVFDAYRKAEAALAASTPGCHLPWQLLAGIGQVESGQADGGRVDAAGTTYTPILGPVLDGNGFAAIADTDGGRYDGSAVWDRAVGPMQFIPSTWAVWGADGNGDGRNDPNNIWDAALAAGRYLCAGGRDLSVPAQLDRAVLGYNNSTEYLRTVRSWMVHFQTGTSAVADAVARPASPSPSPSPSPSAPAPAPKPSPSPTAGTGATTPSPSASASPTHPTPSPSPTPSGTPSGCPSPTATPSAAPSGSASPTATPSAAASPSPSAATASPSPSPSGSPTLGCPSPSPSTSASPSPTPSPSAQHR
ncbi:lytic transglycosylase domain-containing protein [Kitasatospora paracochleata]|uniref:Transglycosylase SLT domain-containing protein n=2 Tax=Kitasatospora paracochleata TaxID=58354 RepID=A0ABT1JAA1_9ACTN|nr:lytic transglycosylase domain-containing protein [Kitasatospora paracochleata]MCP2314393.1 hypothetical protein [Kitasatospora paracochleata]